jgi:glycosyltransferase involved in cell wall biosynthesis
MSDLRQSNLVLFFTNGVSLKTWSDMGLLDREVSLYQSLRQHMQNITFVTYGDAKDLCYANRLEGIRIICNRWGLSQQWYVYLLSFLYPLLWHRPSILKSNQIPGAEIALKVAKNFGMKFIARCGYLPSNITIWRYGEESSESQRAQQLESTVFQAADCVVVTTHTMRQTLVERYNIKHEKIQVIPNYVDIQRFKPFNDSHESNLLFYLGRLEKEKNVQALLNAIQGLDVELMVIGGGNLKEELMLKAQENRLQVNFLGNVPNDKLPSYFNRASLFVLPSFIEHHPKALLEAMACGLPVIGTDVLGIRELIHHRETGYLCGTSSEEIRVAIEEVLSDIDLRNYMGRNARNFVIEHCRLEQIVEMELTLLNELVK